MLCGDRTQYSAGFKSFPNLVADQINLAQLSKLTKFLEHEFPSFQIFNMSNEQQVGYTLHKCRAYSHLEIEKGVPQLLDDVIPTTLTT